MRIRKTKSLTCKTCKNAIFDEFFGEYKCLIIKRRIHDISVANKCKGYEKGVPTDSKQKPNED